jgi:TctA family transporter
MAMILPVTFWLSPVGALIMLSGVFYGAQYGGSTTAILVKIPGETSSVITVLDGHAMAQRGRAGPALAIAALGSLFAGSVVTLLIAIGGPPLAKIALLFQSADYVSVMLLGLVSAVVLAHGSVLKAIGMIVLGVMLGLVGTDVSTGEYRMTMGLDVLFDGIGFVPLSMGLFGLAEIMVNLEAATGAGVQAKMVSGLWPTRADLKRSFAPMVRGTVIGTAFGILPGGGPTIAAFSAYSLEKKISKTPERFGKGAIEGVAAPESANNAGCAGMLHSHAQSRHSAQCADGADDRRHDGARHHPWARDHHQAARAVLGVDREHVVGKPDARRPQSAIDRALGEAAAGALRLSVPDHPDPMLCRHLHAQLQHRRRHRHDGVRRHRLRIP